MAYLDEARGAWRARKLPGGRAGARPRSSSRACPWPDSPRKALQAGLGQKARRRPRRRILARSRWASGMPAPAVPSPAGRRRLCLRPGPFRRGSERGSPTSGQVDAAGLSWRPMRPLPRRWCRAWSPHFPGPSRARGPSASSRSRRRARDAVVFARDLRAFPRPWPCGRPRHPSGQADATDLLRALRKALAEGLAIRTAPGQGRPGQAHRRGGRGRRLQGRTPGGPAVPAGRADEPDPDWLESTEGAMAQRAASLPWADDEALGHHAPGWRGYRTDLPRYPRGAGATGAHSPRLLLRFL